MKSLQTFLSILLIQTMLGITLYAQHCLKANKIKLPGDISYYDNQFSSLYIAQDKLYLMSECRIEDNSPAFIAFADLEQMNNAIKDSNYTPKFHRIALKNLDIISDILKDRKQVYEGLEAMAIDGNTYYFSIETNTPSDSCYIIKGDLKDSAIQLNTTHFLAIPKPKDENGKNIYNAGFESLEINNGKLYAFFEYNYFNNGNNVVTVDLSLDVANVQRIAIAKIPFRITDVSWDEAEDCYWAINYFYQGGGGDAVYRVAENDPNYKLMYTSNLRSYTRIIQIKKENGAFTYRPLADLPLQYWTYNWEGLARYKKGFFILNDKYTPKRPYISELLYLEKVKK
ncbi:MAG: hypothetical protein QM610_11180 [Chitinophagaceae bacterium]